MLEYFIVSYGYPALALGAIIEGEVVLIIAGFSAYLGYMNLTAVIIVSFIFGMIGDQIYFHIGRKKGRQFIENRPELKKQALWVQRIFEKHANLVLLLFRFAYGFRIIVPITLGTCKISIKRFTFFNAVGALIWSTLFSFGGYFFGSALETLFQDLRKYELRVISVIILVAIILGFVVLIRKQKFLKKFGVDSKIGSDMII